MNYYYSVFFCVFFAISTLQGVEEKKLIAWNTYGKKYVEKIEQEHAEQLGLSDHSIKIKRYEGSKKYRLLELLSDGKLTAFCTEIKNIKSSAASGLFKKNKQLFRSAVIEAIEKAPKDTSPVSVINLLRVLEEQKIVSTDQLLELLQGSTKNKHFIPYIIERYGKEKTTDLSLVGYFLEQGRGRAHFIQKIVCEHATEQPVLKLLDTLKIASTYKPRIIEIDYIRSNKLDFCDNYTLDRLTKLFLIGLSHDSHITSENLRGNRSLLNFCVSFAEDKNNECIKFLLEKGARVWDCEIENYLKGKNSDIVAILTNNKKTIQRDYLTNVRGMWSEFDTLYKAISSQDFKGIDYFAPYAKIMRYEYLNTIACDTNIKQNNILPIYKILFEKCKKEPEITSIAEFHGTFRALRVLNEENKTVTPLYLLAASRVLKNGAQINKNLEWTLIKCFNNEFRKTEIVRLLTDIKKTKETLQNRCSKDLEENTKNEIVTYLGEQEAKLEKELETLTESRAEDLLTTEL